VFLNTIVLCALVPTELATAAQNENYYVYQFPMRSSVFYETLRADLPEWETLDAFQEGLQGWAYLFLRNMAQANELLQQGNPKLAGKYAADASSIYIKELQRCWATVPGMDTSAVTLVRWQMNSRLLVPADATGANEQLAHDLVLAQDKSICDAFKSTTTGIGWNGADARNILFAFYYYRHFSHPLLLSDIARDGGDYPTALRHLLTVYGNPLLYLAYTSSTDIEQFAEYRRPGTAAGVANYGPGLPASEQPGADDRSRYGRCWFDIVTAGRCSSWAEIGSSESDTGPTLLEKRVLTKRAAYLYLEWGDLLFRQQDLSAAGSRYTQVLRLYRNEWQIAVGLVPGTTAAINPEVLSMIRRADVQLRKIRAGLNYLGYSSTYVPIWSYRYLKDAAKHFIDMARGLERDALSFLTSAEKEFEQVLQLAASIDIANKMVAVESARVEQATTAAEIASLGERLAHQRSVNLAAQMADFQNTHPIATGKDTESYNKVLDVFEGGKYGAEIGSFVGSVFGWSTSGGMQRREARDQYNQMDREQNELFLAEQIAGLEATRAQQELQIAKLNREIAEIDLRAKRDHLDVARSKTLTTQFWHELSRDIRKKAHRYLDYGIQLAWLTEQAYEFETAKNVNLIKFDYLSGEGWLAADQLALDLDTLEFDRLTQQRQKEIPLTHVISLRSKDLLALERLRRDGSITFDTTAQDFDFAHPGTFNRRIKKVELIVPALYGRDGFRGRITKNALSIINVLNERQPNGIDTFADWLQYTPTPSRRRLLATPEETMVLSRVGAQSMAGGEPFNKEGQKHIFEDHGVTGTWRLEIPTAINDFDLGTIMDVILKIDFTANYSETLKEAVQLERRKLEALSRYTNGNIVAFSMRRNVPDEYYRFFNPSSAVSPCPSGTSCQPRYTGQYRVVAFQTRATDAPYNQVNQRLTQLSLALFDQQGLAPGKLRVTSQRLNPALAFEVRGGLLVLPTGKTINDIKWFPNDFTGATLDTVLPGQAFPVTTDKLAPLGAELFDTWLVRLDLADNPQLAAASGGSFDDQKVRGLKDLILQLGYQFNVRGVANAPITRWAHFSETPTVPRITVVQGSNANTRSWTVPAGANWTVRTNDRFLSHAASTGVETIESPAMPGDRFLPAGGFALALDADLTDQKFFEVSCRGNQARYDLQLRRNASGDYWVRVHRFKDGTNTLPKTEPNVVLAGTPLRLNIIKRKTAAGVRIMFYINGTAFYATEETDTSFMDRFETLVLSSDGAVNIDNILIADLTNYPE